MCPAIWSGRRSCAVSKKSESTKKINQKMRRAIIKLFLIASVFYGSCLSAQVMGEVQDSAYVARDVSCKPFYMDIRTNMLYDALLIPNIGAEFYLGKNWSAVANWMYGWWKTDRSHWYWRAYGGDIALRKWFGRTSKEKPLTGHHIGIYGQIFTYDIETGSRGYMGGKPGGTLWNKMNYAAGVEYGYSFPVARRVNIELSLGMGYWGGTYHEYKPEDSCYVWQSTKQRHWFGPTKAEMSLVWLIGRGNYNKEKGGKL